MKKSLGSILLLLFLSSLPLEAAKLADYTITMSKKEAYLKEAVTITFTAKQRGHTTHMYFFLKPEENTDYKIYLLKKENKELSEHNSISIFTYILFPLKTKKITINFDFTIKTASDQAVKQAYIADHDDSIAINMNQKKIIIKPLILKVKELKKNVDLVGEFKLDTKIDRQTINQYESVNLIYTLYGKGYNEQNLSLLSQIPTVTQFFENENDDLKLTKEGFKIKKRFIYSLSSTKSFTIPSVTLTLFSAKKNHYYTLKSPAYHINIKKIPISSLLDKEEYPKKKSSQLIETFKQFFIYLLLFLSGYLTAKILQKMPQQKKKQKRLQDIQESTKPKELILLLLNKYQDKNLEKFVEELERLIYKREGNFKKIKKAILKQINPD